MAELIAGRYYNLTEDTTPPPPPPPPPPQKEECDLKVNIPCINGPIHYGGFKKRIIKIPKPRRDKPCLEKWYDEYRKKFEDCEDLQ